MTWFIIAGCVYVAAVLVWLTAMLAHDRRAFRAHARTAAQLRRNIDGMGFIIAEKQAINACLAAKLRRFNGDAVC